MKDADIDIPRIGFGTWKLEAGETCSDAVRCAIKAGFRYIDTAAAYLNEGSIGQALVAAMVEDGVARDELYISGKLWNTKRGYDKVKRACMKTIKRLRLEYLDLYLVHWPSSPAFDDDWRNVNLQTWHALESLMADGYVRAIGVCNYLTHHLESLLEGAEILPAVNQVELHPGFLQAEVLSYCNKIGIQPEAWSPLGHGELISHPLVMQVADNANCTPAQVCLAWAAAHGAIPIVKTTSEERMRENLYALQIALKDSDVRLLDGMENYAHSGMTPDQVNSFR